jgi:hypothetical protein
VNRLLSRVSVRATSVGLLVVGVIGGVYIGQDHEVQKQDRQASLVVQADADETQLLKSRQSEHAAARAYQREAEDDAAAQAATAAKAAATKAHALEKKVIAKKAAAKAAADAKKEESTSASSGSGSGSGSASYSGPIPTSCNSYSGNHAIGCALMLDAGFKIDQFPCLDKLWNRESGWNERASNAGSGAYGIPQALPGSKMASIASDWESNPATQIKWGLGYIEGRYSTPCGAWSHSESTGWY